MSDLRAHLPMGRDPGHQEPTNQPGVPAPAQLPPFSKVVPLVLAAVVLLGLLLLLVRWVLGPGDFTQRVIAFGVAAALTMWLVYVLDGAQRRSMERLRGRMELERQRDIARALADEREQRLREFMGSFVVKVHGSAGEFMPYPNPMAINVAATPYPEGTPRAITAPDPRAERPAGTARPR